MQLIRQGSKGPTVTAIQRFLVGRGAKIVADGDFGPKTRAAVVAYQRLRGLAADGIVGNATLGAMLADGLALMPTPDTAPAGTFPAGFPIRPAGVSPLSSAGADAAFGRYAYVAAPTPTNPEAIRIIDGWDSANIRLVKIPQLAALGLSSTGNARMHRLVVPQTLGLWEAWDRAGLLPRVISWEDMFVARFVRGSRTTLSNHAKGSAFDINAGQNGLGRVPAAVGARGSVRELVPLAIEFGFYWGGWFSRGDGMHFEVRRVLTADQVSQALAKI